jgi:cell division protein FtsZ
LINRDFSDIRTIMLGMGYAMMGTATAKGPNAPLEAAQSAINSPLMEEGGVLGARGVLINITASSQIGIHEVNEACNLIRSATQNEDVQINFGVVMDEKMGDAVKVTVIATGFQRDSLPEFERRSAHFPFNAANTPENTPTSLEREIRVPDLFPKPVMDPEPVVAVVQDEPEDVEVPAILRKRRVAVGN